MLTSPSPARVLGRSWRRLVAAGALRLACAAGLAVAGCGGSNNPPGDAGRDQASADLGPDASADLGPPVDQGPSGCFAEGRADVAVDPSGAPIEFALAAGHTDFAIAYVAPSEGGARLQVRRVSHDNVLGAPAPLDEVAAGARAHEPTLLRTEEGWLAGWTRHVQEPESTSIRGRALLPDVSVDPSAAGDERDLAGLGTSSPSLAATGGRVYFAYLAQTDDGPRVYHRALDGAGEPLEDALAVSAIGASPVRVRNVGAAVGGYIVWAEEDGEILGRRVVSSALLDPSTPTLSDPSPTPTGVFALGNSGVVHAAVWGVEDRGHRAARIRVITEEGNPASQAVVLRMPSVSAEPTAFSLARFAAGFALVYRSKSPGQNRLRVLLHDSDAQPVFDVAISFVLDAEGDVAVRQATDGTLQLAWTDHDFEGATHLVTARLTCRP